MQINLPGVAVDGTVDVVGPTVRFAFEHRGQAFVRMRVSWDIDKPPIVHPFPSGTAGQPQPRTLAPGRYLVSVRVHATDLPGLPNASINSNLSINGKRVLVVTGKVPEQDPKVDIDGRLFFLIVS
ncbi:MAG: hypothetical protein LH480_11365 [Rubrivivax sp.]|nr:hypothetical protein [Rubrivivax sp.]